MRLETERLILRDFVAADWTAVHAYQSDPRYLRFYAWTERTPADAQAFVGMFLDQQTQRPRTRFQLAVVLRGNGRLIGNCGVRISDPAQREASLGYELDPAHWGQGYATEAARAMLAFGFEHLHVCRVWAEVLAENEASRRVLARLGLRPTPADPVPEQIKGHTYHKLVYAISAREWRRLQASSPDEESLS